MEGGVGGRSDGLAVIPRPTGHDGQRRPRRLRRGASALLAAGVMGTWGLVSAAPVTATAEVESTPTPSGPSMALVGTVVVRDLPAKASAGHPAQHKPFRTPRPRPPGTSAPANGTVAVQSAGPRSGGATA